MSVVKDKSNMRIGSMTEGTGQYPTWYDLVEERDKKKDKHTLSELAEKFGVSKGSIVRGLKGVIKPDGKIKEGRQSLDYYSEADLQWLEDEVAAGRKYPVRVNEDVFTEDQDAVRETILDLIDHCAKVQKIAAVENSSNDEEFKKLFRKSIVARKTMFGLLEAIIDTGPKETAARLAEAALVTSRLSESIGKTQKRWDELQDKKG